MGANITIPQKTGETYGLSMYRDKWHVVYYKDGKVCRKSLGTTDLGEAQLFRNIFYRKLRLKGAKRVGNSGRKPKKISPDSDEGIYTSYRVVVGGVRVGSSSCLKKARKMRNDYIKNLDK